MFTESAVPKMRAKDTVAAFIVNVLDEYPSLDAGMVFPKLHAMFSEPLFSMIKIRMPAVGAEVSFKYAWNVTVSPGLNPNVASEYVPNETKY